ncbi:BlaI/MecI/CopY family transcriptional regulator [Candidatus Shapirobacteria bacterium]|nr:BlaI/MecI/CopY family transcriptional regulator [Candidatus Shapirobacteria bacterium]
MNILWSVDKPLKPAEVLKEMKGDYAYTTIMTVLKRLADKKLVYRVSQANTFVYTPIQCKSAFACDCLGDLFDRLFETFGPDVVTHFKTSASRSGFKL